MSRGGEISPMTKLQEIREASGLTRNQLAEMTGVSFRMISYYENGSKDINRAEALTVYKLAQALFCTVEDLLEK